MLYFNKLDILIFFFVPHEVFFGGIVGPNVFDGLVDFGGVVVQFFEVFYYFVRGAGAGGVINQFFFGGRPRSVIQAAG